MYTLQNPNRILHLASHRSAQGFRAYVVCRREKGVHVSADDFETVIASSNLERQTNNANIPRRVIMNDAYGPLTRHLRDGLDVETHLLAKVSSGSRQQFGSQTLSFNASRSRKPSMQASAMTGATEAGPTDLIAKMSAAVRTILECLGEDPDREGLRNTPERYAKAMLFFTRGYGHDLSSILNNAMFEERYGGMVIVRDIQFSSLCEHHLAPFFGKMHVGYVADGKVVGLSKIARVTEMLSQRLQIQERLTEQVATTLRDLLEPKGIAVVIEASHNCMAMRGVQKPGSTTITSRMLGCFECTLETRAEFLALIGRQL